MRVVVMDDDIMPKSKATIEAEKRKKQVKRKTPDDAGAGVVKMEVTTNAGDDSPVRVVPTDQDVDTLVAEDVEHHDTTTTDGERQAREYDLYIEKLKLLHASLDHADLKCAGI